MTPLLVETERGVKATHRSARVLPETVIYDPELVAHLPASVAGPSAMNGMANAVQALCGNDSNPLTGMMAEEAIRALGAAIPPLSGGPGGSGRVDPSAIWLLVGGREHRFDRYGDPSQDLRCARQRVRSRSCGCPLRDAALHCRRQPPHFARSD